MENMIRFPQPSKSHYRKKSGVRCLQNRSVTARDKRWKVKNQNRAQNKDAIMGGNYDCCKKSKFSKFCRYFGYFITNTNVIFLLLGCGLFFFRYSLSSANKMEEGKDMFECQIHN